jgi:hypothetical protein
MNSVLIAVGLSRAGGTLTAIANIWLCVWAIRHKGQLDYELAPTAKWIRWIVVAMFLGTPIFRPELFGARPTLRVCIGMVGLLFLVWPNFAYHSTRCLRAMRLIRKSENPATS